MFINNFRFRELSLFLALPLAGILSAQTTTAPAKPAAATTAPADAVHTDLAKQAQNPIASMATLPFLNSTNFGVGDTRRVNNTLLIQPVIPFKLSDNLNLISRTIIPVIRQPVGTDDSFHALGSITQQFYFVPAHTKGFTFGFGPQFQIPTETNSAIGPGKWGMGPDFVILTMPGPWVLGVLYTQMFDFAGDPNRPGINTMIIQPIINYNLGKGWAITAGSMSWVANFKAPKGEQWNVPLGGGVGKVFSIGKQHVKAQVAVYANVVHPTGAPDTVLQTSFTFLFPK